MYLSYFALDNDRGYVSDLGSRSNANLVQSDPNSLQHINVNMNFDTFSWKIASMLSLKKVVMRSN